MIDQHLQGGEPFRKSTEGRPSIEEYKRQKEAEFDAKIADLYRLTFTLKEIQTVLFAMLQRGGGRGDQVPDWIKVPLVDTKDKAVLLQKPAQELIAQLRELLFQLGDDLRPFRDEKIELQPETFAKISEVGGVDLSQELPLFAASPATRLDLRQIEPIIRGTSDAQSPKLVASLEAIDLARMNIRNAFPSKFAQELIESLDQFKGPGPNRVVDTDPAYHEIIAHCEVSLSQVMDPTIFWWSSSSP